MAGHVARTEEGRSALKIVAGTPAGKRKRGVCLIRLIIGIIEDFL